MMRRLALSLLALLLFATPAVAQDTGGSFGGGDFGGGSDYGSSDYGSSDYGSSDYGSSDYGSNDYGGGGGSGRNATPLEAFFLFFLPVGLVVFFFIRAARSSKKVRSGGHGSMDVTAVVLGLDWRARRAIQAHLRRFAKQHDPQTPNGRATLVRETARLLIGAKSSWLYAAARSFTPMSSVQAEGIFRELGIAARSRFEKDVIRRDQGQLTERAAGAQRARSDEGEGVVVITFLVAARRELVDITDASDPAQLMMALLELQAFAAAHAVAAFEVIWSPAVDEDRMSTAELEALYPELRPVAGALRFGRVECSHCRAPFAAELGRCPHCGATLDAAARG